jgi:hypothetical protein
MDFGVILIVAIICVAIGYFAGLMLTNLNKDRSEPDIKPEEPVAGESGPRFEADHLTMVLWSKTPDGPLFADINGKQINTPTDLSVSERVRVDKALNDFQMWLGRPILRSGKTGELPLIPNNGTLPQVDQPVLTEIQDEPLAASPESSIPLSNEEKVNLTPVSIPTASPAETNILSEPVTPVSPVPAVISLRSKPKPAAPPPKSIVGQINDILQEKVKDSPLAESGIKLQETPKGVVVWVGMLSYQGLDTLPEGDAKKIIRAAVAEWEKK